jgi:hypothetical protein
MSPKEKAKELYAKFYMTIPSDEMGKCDEASRQCALIAVNQVIEFMEADDFDSDTCYWANHSQMKYWTEVKQEIENL